MRAFLSSVAVAIVIALGSAYVLNAVWQESAAQAYSTSGVRLGDPGHNLVGPDYGS